MNREAILLKVSETGKREKVFRLDTGNYGEDDLLLGTSREEVLRNVLHHHEMEGLPEDWTLEEVPEDMVEAYLEEGE